MKALTIVLGLVLGIAVSTAVDRGRTALAITLALVGPFILGALW